SRGSYRLPPTVSRKRHLAGLWDSLPRLAVEPGAFTTGMEGNAARALGPVVGLKPPGGAAVVAKGGGEPLPPLYPDGRVTSVQSVPTPILSTFLSPPSSVPERWFAVTSVTFGP